MAQLFPRRDYADTILEGAVVGVPQNGNSYSVVIAQNNFTSASQGLRLEMWQQDPSLPSGYRLVGASPPINENDPDSARPFMDGGQVDRFGQIIAPSIGPFDGVSNKGFKVRVAVRGSVNFSVTDLVG